MKKIMMGILSVGLMMGTMLISSQKIHAEVTPQPGVEDIKVWGGGMWIFLNGNAIILDEGDSEDLTKLYIDKNANGVLDATDELQELVGASGSLDDGYDLSGSVIYAVGMAYPNSYDSHVGDIMITMLGGNIQDINGSMECKNTGDFYFRMTGGTVSGQIMPAGSADLTGNVDVSIGGNAKVGQAVFGAGENSGIRVNGQVTITIQDNAQINYMNYGNGGVFAGGQQPGGTVTGTGSIFIKGGVINGMVAGDLYKTSFAKKVSINISAGQISKVIGISNSGSTAPSVELNLSGGTISKNVIGSAGKVNDSVLINVNGSTIKSALVGGNGGTAKKITMNLNAGDLQGGIIGTTTTTVDEFAIHMNDGHVTNIIGKQGDSGTWKKGTIHIQGGHITKTVAIKSNDSNLSAIESQNIIVEGAPEFSDDAYVLLRTNEYIQVKDRLLSDIHVKAPTDVAGTLLAKPYDDLSIVDTAKIKVNNSLLDVVYGNDQPTYKNVYLGTENYSLKTENIDFGQIYIDSVSSIQDQKVSIVNTGNKAVTLKDIDDYSLLFSFDKKILYPGESSKLTVHLKKVPEISNGTNKESLMKDFQLNILENKDFYYNISISLDLIQTGYHKTEVDTVFQVDSDIDSYKDQLLTQTDKDMLKNGANIIFKLFVEDANQKVDNTTKQDIEKYNHNYQVGQYLDIYVNKYTDDVIESLSELSQPIRLVIDIPDNLRKSNRNFYILRTHIQADGTSQISMLEDLDNDVNTYTFETNQFSTYALMYEDMPTIEDDSPTDQPNSMPDIEIHPEGDQTQNESQIHNETKENHAVQTADYTSFIPYICLSGLGLVIFIMFIKKRNSLH